MLALDALIRMMFDKGGSDLHLTVGLPPTLRIHGKMVKTDLEKLKPDTCQNLIYSVLTDEQKERFERDNELDSSFGIQGVGRVRLNVFMQRGAVGAVMRNIPSQIIPFEDLGLPPAVKEIVNFPKGLVLVTGPTGSGKSTTLAAMIDHINRTRTDHIITIEDPIEFVHPHRSCVVNQREVGSDTQTFARALKYVLRQDPDIILVGEMRDLETVEAALTIAETGHLVFATLHTTDAIQTINRIVDVFPAGQQPQVRAQLSFVLMAVLAQQLLPTIAGDGRVAATEVLIVTPAVRNLIREEKVHQISSVMQTGQEVGMQTMNQSLYDLYKKKKVSRNEIFTRTLDPKDMDRLMQTGGQ